MIWLIACMHAEPPAAPVVPDAPVVQPAPPPAPVVVEPPAPAPESLLRTPPPGLVPVPEGIDLDIRYATADNFTGAPLPGYGAPGAWLVPQAADALARVRDRVADQGYGLLVYDAYRPERATLAMVAWTERTGQTHLLDQGYIARRSGHNRGNTVDLTLTLDGQAVDMGTPWDTFSSDSHTANATGDALVLRHVLRDAMVAEGWSPYSKEWWHFGFKLPDLASVDVPYGCWEPLEWTAPADWTAPDWVQPWDPQPCR